MKIINNIISKIFPLAKHKKFSDRYDLKFDNISSSFEVWLDSYREMQEKEMLEFMDAYEGRKARNKDGI